MKILSGKYTGPSSRLLRDKLQQYWEEKIWVTKSGVNIEDEEFIRYGNTDTVRVNDTNHNPKGFITLCSDKKRFADILLANAISAPLFKKGVYPNQYPVMVRTTLWSYKGKGIIICRNKQDFDDANGLMYYWTPLEDIVKEFRVHIFGGNPVKLMQKVENENFDPNYPIRNSHSANFRRTNLDNYPEISKLSKKVFNIPEINGSFFSLDVGLKRNGDLFIFEANSASGLNNPTAEMLADYLKGQFGK